jgi:hypothetical protein
MVVGDQQAGHAVELSRLRRRRRVAEVVHRSPGLDFRTMAWGSTLAMVSK